jgi:hypothetical protein
LEKVNKPLKHLPEILHYNQEHVLLEPLLLLAEEEVVTVEVAVQVVY